MLLDLVASVQQATIAGTTRVSIEQLPAYGFAIANIARGDSNAITAFAS